MSWGQLAAQCGNFEGGASRGLKGLYQRRPGSHLKATEEWIIPKYPQRDATKTRSRVYLKALGFLRLLLSFSCVFRPPKPRHPLHPNLTTKMSRDNYHHLSHHPQLSHTEHQEPPKSTRTCLPLDMLKSSLTSLAHCWRHSPSPVPDPFEKKYTHTPTHAATSYLKTTTTRTMQAANDII